LALPSEWRSTGSSWTNDLLAGSWQTWTRGRRRVPASRDGGRPVPLEPELDRPRPRRRVPVVRVSTATGPDLESRLKQDGLIGGHESWLAVASADCPVPASAPSCGARSALRGTGRSVALCCPNIGAMASAEPQRLLVKYLLSTTPANRVQADRGWERRRAASAGEGRLPARGCDARPLFPRRRVAGQCVVRNNTAGGRSVLTREFAAVPRCSCGRGLRSAVGMTSVGG
jgi:hypothetical protein